MGIEQAFWLATSPAVFASRRLALFVSVKSIGEGPKQNSVQLASPPDRLPGLPKRCPSYSRQFVRSGTGFGRGVRKRRDRAKHRLQAGR